MVAAVGDDAWRVPIGSVLTLDGEERWRHFHSGLPFGRGDLATEHIDEIDAVLVAVGIRSYLSVPMVIAGEVRAVITFSSARPDAIGAESVATFAALVREAAATFNVLMLVDREREAGRRLRDLDRLKNEFVETVAHDFGTPWRWSRGSSSCCGTSRTSRQRNAPRGSPGSPAMCRAHVRPGRRRPRRRAHRSGAFEDHPRPFDLAKALRGPRWRSSAPCIPGGPSAWRYPSRSRTPSPTRAEMLAGDPKPACPVRSP